MSTRDDTANPTSAARDEKDSVQDQSPLPDEDRATAERIIQDHVLLSVISGFIPGPGIDLAAAFAVQLTMIKRLSTVYEIPFRRDAAKSTVTALLGTLGGAGAAAIVAGSFIKFIPFVGTAIGIVSTPVSFGAFTYAIGKVFEKHFEMGGTFIDLDASAYRDYFRDMRKRGRTVAAEKAREAEAVAKEQQKRGRSAPAAASEA